MPASVYDSPLYHRLFDAGETRRLFTDSAEVRAMLLVEGALAKVQGKLGTIPSLSGAAIHRASIEITLDAGGLAEATGQNGVSVPALVAAFRREMQAPEHAQFVHFGATSQDIIDTGLMLRLRQALALAETDLKATLHALAALAQKHAHTDMAARTYGQHATPTTFGAVVANWGMPLLGLLSELETLQTSCLHVSLSGAAGTGSALCNVNDTRAALADALDLGDPKRTWHTDRTPILKISDWMTRVCTALGKMATDLVMLTQTGIEEVSLGGSGASSTMPQKQNPVAPSAMLASMNAVLAAHSALQGAAVHAHQRDGAAWFTEWMMVPQVALGTAAVLGHAKNLSTQISPNPERMSTALEADGGLIYAEALSFALVEFMPRPQAQTQTKELCKTARQTGRPLHEVAQEAFPDLPAHVFAAKDQNGDATSQAAAFAKAVATLT